jgi:hypothetical protein
VQRHALVLAEAHRCGSLVQRYNIVLYNGLGLALGLGLNWFRSSRVQP